MDSDTGSRIIAGLLSNEAILVANGPKDAVLQFAGGMCVVVIDLEKTDSLPEAVAQVKAWVKKLKSSTAHGVVQFVGIGQSKVIAKAFNKSAPFLQLGTQFGFHQVFGPPYSTKRITGARFPQLNKLAKNLADIAPLTPESCESHIAATKEAVEQESQLNQALATKFPWVTTALVVACVAMFALSKLWAHGNYNLTLFKMGANHGGIVKDGEVWRLLSSAFLHGSVEHLFVNMIALLSFGPLLERLLGSRRYIFLYGVAALGGSLASAFLRPEPVLSVGASGAIWGLMAAGVGLALKPRDLLPPLALQSAKKRALIPLGINALYSLTPGVDLLAHLGGGVVGFALMFSGVLTSRVTPLWKPTTEQTESPLVVTGSNTSGWTILGWGTTLSLVGSLLIALATGKIWAYATPPKFARVQIPNTGFSMELPDALGKAATQDNGSISIHTFGSLDNQPSAIEVIVNTLPAAIPPEEMPEAMEQAKAALEEMALPNATRIGSAKITQVGDKQTAIVDHKINQLSLRTWILIQGDKEFAVRQYSLPEPPTDWSDIGERAVKTLAAKPAPNPLDTDDD